MKRYDLISWPDSQPFGGKADCYFFCTDSTGACDNLEMDSAVFVPSTDGEFVRISKNDTRLFQSFAVKDAFFGMAYDEHDSDFSLFVPVKVFEKTAIAKFPQGASAELRELLERYERDSDVCMAEFLASEPVPAGMTFEKAFETYVNAMKWVENDRFFTIKEGKMHKL